MTETPTIINELRVLDLARNKEEPHKYILLYKDKLFILDDKSPLRSVNSRIKRQVKSHPGMDPESKYGILKQNDLYEFLTRMAELAPDVVVGDYYPSNQSLTVWSSSEVQPKTSLNVKKLVKQLDIKNITYMHRDHVKNSDDDVIVGYSSKKLHGGIPDVGFHGTNSHTLGDILRFGLYPEHSTPKFYATKLFPKTYVFFSAVFHEAIYYAFNAVYTETKRKWGNFPMVIEFEIPDKNLVFQDYDADVSTTSPRYFPRGKYPPNTTSTMKAMGISRETGKWSYKGRIPTSFIRWVYYYVPYDKVWKKSSPETWKKILNKHDWDTIGYKLRMDSDDYE